MGQAIPHEKNFLSTGPETIRANEASAQGLQNAL
jgi:hypothetical protein